MPRKAPEDSESTEIIEPAGVLAHRDGDGLPYVIPEEAAARALAFIDERKLGPKISELVGYIASRAVDTSDLNVVILEQLADRLLAAESPEDVLTPFDPLHGQDYIDVPLQIESVQYLESDYSEGFPWFASLSVIIAGTGEEKVLTIGGEEVLYKLAALDMHDAWPVVAQLTRKKKPTKQGYYPLDLKPVS